MSTDFNLKREHESPIALGATGKIAAQSHAGSNDLLHLPESRLRAISSRSLVERQGRVHSVLGNRITASLPTARLGELCILETVQDRQPAQRLAEVTAFDGHLAHLACLESTVGLAVGSVVTALGCLHQVDVSQLKPGCVLDGFGRQLSSRTTARTASDLVSGAFCLHGEGVNVVCEAPDALQRPPIDQMLPTGVTVIDCTCSLGQGQRVGIFAGPGCGKSTLLAQIARGVDVDYIVLALVGERGRELREFIEREFDDATRARCVFVCATSDRSAIERVRAAFTATAIAENYREQGHSVLLMVDSLTRLARAQREIGLQAGEPATRNGLTPSVYALLPTLVERAGRGVRGDITALYTILLETEHIHEDALASEAKSLLDGHLVLRPALAQRGQYPALSIRDSLSRVMDHLISDGQLAQARDVRSVLAQYSDVELLLRLNEYQRGSDPATDRAIAVKPLLDQCFRQARDEARPVDMSWRLLSDSLRG
jgi:type III secretion protein N (ATPase)